MLANANKCLLLTQINIVNSVDIIYLLVGLDCYGV